MANQEHLDILKQGPEVWNKWREENPLFQKTHGIVNLPGGPNLAGVNLQNTYLAGADLRLANLSEAYLGGTDLTNANLSFTRLQNTHLPGADLTGADLSNADLSGTNLSGAILSKADLRNAYLRNTDLIGVNLRNAKLQNTDLVGVNLIDADLTKANLAGAILSEAKLVRAKLREAKLGAAHLDMADLRDADLRDADLSGANLSGANLSGANLTDATLTDAFLKMVTCVNTSFKGAVLSGSKVYGISAWDINLEGAKQENLIITNGSEAEITVDNLEVAQFIYLLLHNQKIRDILDTISKKSVLILGRFTPERKPVLDNLRQALRDLDYVPIMFDFERAESRDFTEIIKTLAGLCLFVIADLTKPKSVPHEMQATIPDYRIPFVPIIEEGESPYAMFKDLTAYSWVLDTLIYSDAESLIKTLEKAIIQPALIKSDELLAMKAESLRTRHTKDYE